MLQNFVVGTWCCCLTVLSSTRKLQITFPEMWRSGGKRDGRVATDCVDLLRRGDGGGPRLPSSACSAHCCRNERCWPWFMPTMMAATCSQLAKVAQIRGERHLICIYQFEYWNGRLWWPSFKLVDNYYSNGNRLECVSQRIGRRVARDWSRARWLVAPAGRLGNDVTAFSSLTD